MGDDPGGAEDSLGGQPGDRHDRPEQGEEAQRQTGPVVTAVDEQQGQRDEVPEDEGDYPSEGDPSLPQCRGQRDVADRADEADDGDEGADDGVLDARPESVPVQE